MKLVVNRPAVGASRALKPARPARDEPLRLEPLPGPDGRSLKAASAYAETKALSRGQSPKTLDLYL